MIKINRIYSHYHAYLPDNVVRIVTLIEFKIAIDRGLSINIFYTYREMHITSTTLFEDYL